MKKIPILIFFITFISISMNAVGPSTDVASTYNDKYHNVDNKRMDFTMEDGIVRSSISKSLSESAKVYPSSGSKKVLAIMIGYSDLSFSGQSFVSAPKKNIIMYASAGILFIIFLGLMITVFVGGKRGLYLNVLQIFMIGSLLTLAGCPQKAEDPVPYNIYDKILNGSGMSFNKYYKDMSNNQLNVTFDFVGPYKTSNTLSYYGSNNTVGDDQNLSELLDESLTQAAEAGVNFADYDDGSGNLSFIVIHAGGGEEAFAAGVHPEYIWSCSGSATSGSIGGLDIDKWAVVPEYYHTPGDSTIGVFCHEFGHMLGLPDLYDTDYTTDGVGRWSLMAGGSWNGANHGDRPAPLLAWEKNKLGWITINTISAGTTGRAVEDIETSRMAYKLVLHAPEQYYLLENKFIRSDTWTSGIPGSGLLITHIHDNVISYYISANDINNTNSRSHGINIVEADNNNELWSVGAPYGEAGDLFYSGNKTSITPSTSPNSNYYNATSYPFSTLKTQNSGVNITNISAAGSTMTFDF